jgi:hypothetical protein
MEVGEIKGRKQWGKVFTIWGSRECGGLCLDSPAFQDPGPSPIPAMQKTLTDPGGTEGWAPSRPENDNGEMLWCWVVVQLGRGERAVHWAPSPAAGGGP